MNGSRVLVLGLAYKPNVDDERESPSYRIMELLKRQGAEVSYHDPYVPVIGMTREHAEWAGTALGGVGMSDDSADSIWWWSPPRIHASITSNLADWSRCIVDTRNVMAESAMARRQGLEGLMMHDAPDRESNVTIQYQQS